MEYWYGKSARWATNIIAIFITMSIVATSTIAIGYLLHYFLNIPQNAGMIIGLAVVTVYSVFGGITSVAFTDVFQFLVFFVVLPIVCIIGYQHIDGSENIWFSLPNKYQQIKIDNFSLFVSLVFFALIPNFDIPYIQRALMAKDKKQFLQSFVGVAILLIPVLIIVCTIGLMMHWGASNINSNMVLYYFIDHYLPIGIKGLMVAGLLAVIMSTQDSYLNTTSVLIAHDICKQISPNITNKQELFIVRTSCIIISLFSVILIFSQKSIMDIVWLIDNFALALISTPLFAKLVGVQTNKKAFTITTLVSLGVIIITRLTTGVFDTRSIATGVLASAIVLYILHKRYKGESIFSFPKINVSLLFDKLNKRVLNNSYSISSLYTVGIVLCINFLASIFFINLDFFNPLNISLGVMTCLFIMLLLNELWYFQLKRYLIDIWRFCLIIGLLFIPSYIFFVQKFHILWLCNLILSAILYIVMSDIVIGIAFILIAGSIGYLLPQIFYVKANIIEITFANISCPAMLIAILIQLYNRHTITKTTHKEITYELKKIMQEK
ncbi:MAG: hypothetical protein HRU36_05365, partial [Rickettsiales bacterium]|nr:hypothetical protein [Rickettsiales bacterium]